MYIERTITKTVQANNPFRNSTMAKGQRALNFPRLSPAEKSELDFQAAMWCFMGNHSFRMFENPFGKKFLHALNPAYKPPSRKTLSGPLLDSTYVSTQTHMNELIATMSNLNIVTDESSNIAGARICNITIHSASGSLHCISEDIRAKQMNAAAAAQWLRNHLLALSNGDLSLINSLTMDTCALMFAMWLELQRFPDLKYCLFIPCDSHGIQLLIKDLLLLPAFKDILKKAQIIVTVFHHSLLQYAHLREYQR